MVLLALVDGRRCILGGRGERPRTEPSERERDGEVEAVEAARSVSRLEDVVIAGEGGIVERLEEAADWIGALGGSDDRERAAGFFWEGDGMGVRDSSRASTGGGMITGSVGSRVGTVFEGLDERIGIDSGTRGDGGAGAGSRLRSPREAVLRSTAW